MLNKGKDIENKSFLCDMCQKAFHSEAVFNIHIESHINVKDNSVATFVQDKQKTSVVYFSLMQGSAV